LGYALTPILGEAAGGFNRQAERPGAPYKLEGIGPDSGEPSDLKTLRAGLRRLRAAALASIPDRTQNVTVELVGWMEMRQDHAPSH